MVDKDELLCTSTDASGTYRVDRMLNSVTRITFLTLGDETHIDLRSQLPDLKSVIVKKSTMEVARSCERVRVNHNVEVIISGHQCVS